MHPCEKSGDSKLVSVPAALRMNAKSGKGTGAPPLGALVPELLGVIAA